MGVVSSKGCQEIQSCHDCSFFPPDLGSQLLRVSINKLHPKGAGSFSLLLGCRLVPSTSYTFCFHSLPQNLVKAEKKIFQNGYDSHDGIKILTYSVQILLTCSSKQYLKFGYFFRFYSNCQYYSILYFPITECIRMVHTDMYLFFLPIFNYYILKESLDLLEEPHRQTNSNQ